MTDLKSKDRTKILATELIDMIFWHVGSTASLRDIVIEKLKEYAEQENGQR